MNEEHLIAQIQDFEGQLDGALLRRSTVMFGTVETLRVAADCVEAAAARLPGGSAQLAHGLDILAPFLIDRRGENRVGLEDVVADLDFAARYFLIRDFLYYSYNAPGTVSWKFEPDRVEIRFADDSLPRQYFLAANNWFLESSRLFAAYENGKRIEELLRGTPELEETAKGIEAMTLIHEEAALKLSSYFDLVSDKSVPVGNYSFSQLAQVIEALLVKALYHRYHTRVNSSLGVISIPLEELAQAIADEVPGVPFDTARRVVEDISYGVAAKHQHLDPLYFALFHLPETDEILMLPHEFAVWEGFVSSLRVFARRDPQGFLRGLSNQIGDGLTHRLADAFREAGFPCRTNVSLAGYDPTLPDIDILVVSEERTLGFVVLIAEVKSPLPPRWAKDQLRAIEADSVAKAFGQIEDLRTFLASQPGIAFLRAQLPAAGLPDFDESLVAVNLIVATSDNAGAFFSGRGTVIDFRTLQRLLRACDGDIAYVLTALREIPEWADASLGRQMVEVRVMDRVCSFEGVSVKSLMDFARVAYRSAGVPEEQLRHMLEDGGRPFDVLREDPEFPES